MMGKRRKTGFLSVTITFLEMTNPPSGAAIANPVPDHLLLMPVLRPTTDFYRYLYNHVGAPWLWSDRRRLDDARLAALLEDPGQFLFVALLEGEPAGFSELVVRDDVCDIAYFGLMPHALGRRIGPWLLDQTIRAAWQKPEVRRLSVNTCSFDHPRALPLYQQMGFVPVGTETKQVPDPRREGILAMDCAPHIPLAAS